MVDRTMLRYLRIEGDHVTLQVLSKILAEFPQDDKVTFLRKADAGDLQRFACLADD